MESRDLSLDGSNGVLVDRVIYRSSAGTVAVSALFFVRTLLLVRNMTTAEDQNLALALGCADILCSEQVCSGEECYEAPENTCKAFIKIRILLIKEEYEPKFLHLCPL